MIRITYDPVANAAYIQLAAAVAPGEVAQCVTVGRGNSAADIVLDFSRGGVLLGIEVQRANKVLPQELLAEAERIGGTAGRG